MKNFLSPLAKIFSSKPSIESEIRELAYKDYPNDVDTQNFIYQKHLDAYKFLKTAQDHIVKDFAVKNYPSNYLMQQHIYNVQMAARKFMSSASNEAAKTIAKEKYPKDYTAQKYIYEGLDQQ